MALSQAKRDELIQAQAAIREAFDKMIEQRVTLSVAALRSIDISITRVSEEASSVAVDSALETINQVLV